ERLYRTGDLGRRGADGLLYFAGRTDTQIKSRGYRIELGEIESALNALPGLRECAVVAVRTEGFEGWMICCAYVTARGANIPPSGLRQSLASAVPAYMLPARWMHCDALPRNANRKADSPALRRLARIAQLVGTSAASTPDARTVSTSSEVRPHRPEPVRGAAVGGRRELNHRG